MGRRRGQQAATPHHEGTGRRKGRVFVISSPSGGGKTTLVARLLRALPRLERSISVTTRPPRRGERQGHDYQFISLRTFRRLRQSGSLLEWAKVHGAYYGTPKDAVIRTLAHGQDVILSIDVQGARQVRRALGSAAVLIFLLPPSVRQLRQRLMQRRTDTVVAIRRRLAVAEQEITCAAWYDYTLVNDRLNRAINQLRRIVTDE